MSFEEAGGAGGSGSGSGSSGSGGGGGGGIPAAPLFRDGLTQAAKDDITDWEGLLVGLARADAGPDWQLAARDRRENATGASTTVQVGNAIATVTLPAGVASGAEGNNWRLIFQPASSGITLGVGINRQARTITTSAPAAGVNFNTAAARIRGVSGIQVALSGSDLATENWPNSGSQNFAGGVDPEPIGATLDAQDELILLHYDTNDTIMACRDAWNELDLGDGTTLFCREIGKTDLTHTLESPIGATQTYPFILIYSDGALPAERTQQISGSWSGGGAILNLKLDPGNTFQIRTPIELLGQPLSGQSLIDAIDSAQGSSDWRAALMLRTAIETRDLLDGLLGTGWRTSGGGGGGITLDQAVDGVGAALAMLSVFTYDAASNTFTFTLPSATEATDGVVRKATIAQMRAGLTDVYPDAATVLGFATAAIDAALDIVYAEVSDGAELVVALTAHATSGKPLLLRATAAINNQAHQGRTYFLEENRVVWFRTGDLAGTNLFILSAGGGGDISQDTFDAEQSLRIAGDDLRHIAVANQVALDTNLNTQESADTPLEIVVTADFGAYRRGDVLYVQPGTRDIVRRFNIDTAAEVATTWQALSADSAVNLTAVLQAHAAQTSAALVTITADFATATRNYEAGQRYYIAGHHGVEALMVLVSTRSAGGGGGTGPLVVESDSTAAALNIPANTWTSVADLTIPSARGGSPMAFIFNATASRSAGNGDVDIRVLKDGVAIRTVEDESPLRGDVQHAQLVSVFSDTPKTDSDTVYAVQVMRGQAFTVHDRDFVALGGTDAFVPLDDLDLVAEDLAFDASDELGLAPARKTELARLQAQITDIERHGSVHDIRMIPRGGDAASDIVGDYSFAPIDPNGVPAAAVSVVVTISNGLIAPNDSRFPVAIIRNYDRNGGPRTFSISQSQYDNGISLITGVTDHYEFEFRFYDAAGLPSSVTNPGNANLNGALNTQVFDWYIGAHAEAHLNATQTAEVTRIANARAAAVAGPVTIISNIASYDATQNRFEDSGGNEVVVPNGAIVTLTQAVYDAAVADAGFTPNANAIFLTR